MKHQVTSLLISLMIAGCSQKKNTDKVTNSKTEIVVSPEEEIFYHVFQRSFYDSNNDSHGDLNGFTSKLGYLEDLGVTSILMTPLYKSIYYHNYFPDDFKEIDKEYGTLKDYNDMISTIHKKNMKFYMDMEIHYVTKNHLWFKDSFKNPESKYSEHVIYNGPNNTNPETMIFNLTKLDSYDGKAIDITTVDLYNDDVKTYFYTLFKYWVDPNADGNFEDGVDGFRIDHMMDDLDWKGIRKNLFVNFWAPLFDELRAINPNLKIFGEQAIWKEYGERYFEKGKVDMMFAFSVREALLSFDKTQIINKVDSTRFATPEKKYQLVFLENHDIPRYASVVESNPIKLRLGAFFMIFNKGIPSIYYGQELGMTGSGGMGKFGVSDGNDIPMREAFEWYKTVEGPGMALWYKNTGAWWDQSYLKDNDGISFEEQVNDQSSLLNFYKEIIKIRKSNTAFTRGEQSFVKNESDDIVTFLRWYKDEGFLVICNTSEKKSNTTIQIQDLPFKNTLSDLKLIISDERSKIQINSNSIEIQTNPFGYGVWQLK